MDSSHFRDYVDTRMDALDKRMDAVETRMLAAMNTQADATERSVKRLTEVLDRLDTRILDVERMLAALNGRLIAVGMVWSIVLIVVAGLINAMLR